MQRLFRKSSIRILRKKNQLFYLLSLFLYSTINNTFKNTDKDLQWQNIKIYKDLS